MIDNIYAFSLLSIVLLQLSIDDILTRTISSFMIFITAIITIQYTSLNQIAASLLLFYTFKKFEKFIGFGDIMLIGVLCLAIELYLLPFFILFLGIFNLFTHIIFGKSIPMIPSIFLAFLSLHALNYYFHDCLPFATVNELIS